MKISKIVTIYWTAKPKVRFWTAFISQGNERKYGNRKLFRISFISDFTDYDSGKTARSNPLKPNHFKNIISDLVTKKIFEIEQIDVELLKFTNSTKKCICTKIETATVVVIGSKPIIPTACRVSKTNSDLYF